MKKQGKYLFDFAISYAGEDSAVADELAKKLTEAGAAVFYYPFFTASLWGKSGSRTLAKFFGPATRFFIPVISSHYARKDLPQFEWDVARQEQTKRAREFILPLRLDDTKMVGLRGDVVYLDLRVDPIDTVVGVCMRKLAQLPQSHKRFPIKWVATFGLTIDELLEEWDNDIPDSVSRRYAELCDWLEEDLLSTLLARGFEDTHMVEDKRDGEILSVRLAFTWRPDEKPFTFAEPPWWQVLEILPYEQVYDT